MGRMRIKKKDVVTPFRETVAYRMMLLTLSILLCVYTIYETTVALAENNTLAFIIAAILAVGAAMVVFFNLERLSKARIPQRTLKRMKRR
jgi:hypothetical protein